MQASQRGFTIIELLVAMVLLGIVLAGVAPLLINVSSTGRQGHVDSRSLSDVAIAGALIQSDLGAMRAVDRSTGTNEVAGVSLVASLMVADPRDHDIQFASPTALVFYADVLSLPYSEEVSIYLEQPGVAPPPQGRNYCNDARWCLIRQVRQVNPSRVVAAEVLASARGGFPVSSQCQGGGQVRLRIFCYSESAPVRGYAVPGWTEQCDTSPFTEINEAGQSWSWNMGRQQTKIADPLYFGENTGFYRLDRVTQVRFMPLAGVQLGGDAARKRLDQEMTIRNHLSPEYRRAIMCGVR